MTRLSAMLLVAVLIGGPVAAAVPVTGMSMMAHCETTDMACHDLATLTCCTISPVDVTPPAAAPSSLTIASPGPALVAPGIIAPAVLAAHRGLPRQTFPPGPHRPGDRLRLFATLLI